MSEIGSSQYVNENEKLYAKIYIKYYYSQISSDTEFNRIITNPTNQNEKNIKQRYEEVIPIFDKGIKWYAST